MTRPSHAESARTLVDAYDQGVLGTLDRRDGSPYTSVAEYVLLPNGDALLLVSDLADHTKNIKNDPQASLLVSNGLGDEQPLTDERVTLLGDVELVADEESDEMRERYLEVHPHAETYIDFGDFNFYRFAPDRLRYIGGFGIMGWPEVADYREAEPDPVRHAAQGIIEHMNEDHRDSMLEMVAGLTDHDRPDEAEMTEVDRYGFDLLITRTGEEGDTEQEKIRIPFDDPLEEADQARPAMVELVERARE
jgi:putative heme iron utilization protein